MGVLSQLEPQRVFRFFEEISAIPRGSGNTKAISDWCAAFAEARGLAHYQDALDNVIIIKPATAGYEQAAPVILQGHIDMVCEKAADCTKDMTKEGLDLVLEGDRIRAEGTTLGGDNGIAVAMVLAVLDAKDLAHPRVEVILTSDEEIGMLGAVGLDLSPLKGRKLINIDSEEEGIFTVSCAGGNVTACSLPLVRAPFDGSVVQLTVGGLRGGHSGVEIDKGRANASMLLGRVLAAVQKQTAVRLISLQGGQKDNAIPQQAQAVLAADSIDAVRAVAAAMETAFQDEFRTADPAVFVRTEDGAASSVPMDQATTDKAVCLLSCAPDGIQAMSADIPGLVQTSLNLGVLSTSAETLTASFCIRSSVVSQKEMLVHRLNCLMRTLGGTISVSGDYPAWAYRPDSALRELMVQVFEEQYGKAPKIAAIHAGLECGMFMGKLPDLDCISIGPDMWEVHTHRENMSVSSVQRVWAYLVAVLARMH